MDRDPAAQGDPSRPAHELDPTALSVAAATATGGLGTPGIEGPSRPWTPAAAMEPVLPVAPPPARPGAGRPVDASPEKPERGGRVRALVGVALLLAALAVVVLIVVIVGH